ncbi:hypothetical protein LguiA_003812 [Lonicera macranthoides]
MDDDIAGENPAGSSNPSAELPPKSSKPTISGTKSTIIINNKRKKKKPLIDPPRPSSPSPSSCSSTSSHSVQRGVKLWGKCRNPRVLIGSARHTESDVEAIALPLGMSIAAVVAQVLERKDKGGENMSVDHLSTICTLAVRESLSNVFGDKFDSFARNFEKSFHSTLLTLRLINESSQKHHRHLSESSQKHHRHLTKECCSSDMAPSMSVSGGDDSTRNSSVQDCQTRIAQKQSSTLAENEENLPIDLIYQHDGKISHQLANKSVLRTVQKSFQSTLMNLGLINESSQNHAEEQFRRLNNENCCQEGDSTCNSGLQDCQSEAIKNNMSNWDPPSFCEENMPTDLTNYELALHDEQINRQLVSVSPNELHSAINKNVLTTLQKSVMEQARSNDLKTYEIGLTLRKLKLKETQLSLNSDSNFLERCKLSMGISRASFRAEKFKNQLEDARHSELLKKCIDCLVAGLLIMLACLAYGAYVYSRQRITEATAACTPTKESKSSWWIPNPMASFNSGIHVLMCQVQVGSRMLFGGLMILSITYLLLQRASTSNQTMPVTFILLLLGITCGFAGKLCVDALGGSGYHWLVYWEALCSLHLFSNICISTLFVILHGPIVVSENSKRRTIFPYWIRRFLFYATALLFLPLLCGFSPFAGPGEWKDHFSSLVIGLLPSRVY